MPGGGAARRTRRPSAAARAGAPEKENGEEVEGGDSRTERVELIRGDRCDSVRDVDASRVAILYVGKVAREGFLKAAI